MTNNKIEPPPTRTLVVHEWAWIEVRRRLEHVGLQPVPATGNRYGLAIRPENGISTVAETDEEKAISDRELEVLAGMRRGLTNAEIGQELFISEDTVKTHARRIFRKLGVRDRSAAVAEGYERHYFIPGRKTSRGR